MCEHCSSGKKKFETANEPCIKPARPSQNIDTASSSVANGCCAWRQSCCGGGCCTKLPSCCETGSEIDRPIIDIGTGMYTYPKRNFLQKCFDGDCGGPADDDSEVELIKCSNGANSGPRESDR